MKPNHQQKTFAEQAAQEAVERWNVEHKKGQAVEYQSHPEVPIRTVKTCSVAFVLADNTPAVMLEGIRGAVPLLYCRPVAASAAAEFAAATGRPATSPTRERLRARLTAIALEADLLRGRIRAAHAAIVEGRQLVEFALEIRQLGRDYESLASQCLDLQISADPNEGDAR